MPTCIQYVGVWTYCVCVRPSPRIATWSPNILVLTHWVSAPRWTARAQAWCSAYSSSSDLDRSSLVKTGTEYLHTVKANSPNYSQKARTIRLSYFYTWPWKVNVVRGPGPTDCTSRETDNTQQDTECNNSTQTRGFFLHIVCRASRVKCCDPPALAIDDEPQSKVPQRMRYIFWADWLHFEELC